MQQVTCVPDTMLDVHKQTNMLQVGCAVSKRPTCEPASAVLPALRQNAFTTPHSCVHGLSMLLPVMLGTSDTEKKAPALCLAGALPSMEATVQTLHVRCQSNLLQNQLNAP